MFQDVDALILVAPAIRVFDFLLPPQSGKPGVTQRDGQFQTAQFPSTGGTGEVPQRYTYSSLTCLNASD